MAKHRVQQRLNQNEIVFLYFLVFGCSASLTITSVKEAVTLMAHFCDRGLVSLVSMETGRSVLPWCPVLNPIQHLWHELDH